MGRKGNGSRDSQPTTNWETERTLAAAEADDADHEGDTFASGDSACACGNRELLLEAYLRVVDGKIDPEPLEVESLTCPECGREYEAIQVEGGRIARGDLLGQSDPEE